MSVASLLRFIADKIDNGFVAPAALQWLRPYELPVLELHDVKLEDVIRWRDVFNAEPVRSVELSEVNASLIVWSATYLGTDLEIHFFEKR